MEKNCMEITALGVTVLIAMITSWIAFKQFKTSQAQLKASLFEKRYVIFEAAWTELSEIVQHNPKKPIPISNPSFTNLFPQASYLFGTEIEQYLKLTSSKRVELSMLDSKMKQNGNVMEEDDVSKRLELKMWFSDQARNVKQVFSPYLDFAKKQKSECK